jgi:AcrR family transcriptional regulator
MPPKTRDGRDGQATRAAILDIARSQFGNHGFERTTIRSVASAASVDPALVMHYFGNKAALFAAASQFAINFPDLTGVAPDRLADVLLPVFVEAWGPQGPLLPLLRAAATNRAGAEALSRFSSARSLPRWPPSRPTVRPSAPPWSAPNYSAWPWPATSSACRR